MVTLTESASELKEKIKHDVDHLDYDTLKKVYSFISKNLAHDIFEQATSEFEEKNITPEKINHAVKEYRQSKK